MLKNFRLFPMRLTIHDGGPAAAGAGDAGAGTTAQPADGQQATTDGAKTGPSSGDKATQDAKVAEQQPTKEERLKAYKEFRAANKDLFDEDFQNTFNPRFKTLKDRSDRAEATLKAFDPLVDTLKQAYGGEEDPEKLVEQFMKTNTVIDDMAEEAGLTRDAFLNQLKMQRENRQLKQQQEIEARQRQFSENRAKWDRESVEVQKAYPGFDFMTEAATNTTFRTLINAGMPVREAFESAHHREIVSGALKAAEDSTARNISSTIQAAGNRARESGTSQSPGAVTKIDPSKMTKADRADYARRTRRGEHIKFN